MKIKTAFILCAGYGKRLNPLTLENPKPLIKLNNQTLLENTINIAEKLNIENIKINTFYLEDKIKNFLSKKSFNIKIDLISDGDNILDTGGGIYNLIKSSADQENFIVFNPDTVWNLEYINFIEKMEDYYFEQELNNILLVVKKKFSFDKSLNGDFCMEKNLLTKQHNNDYIFTGCQIINRKNFNYVKDTKFSILDIWKEMMQKNKLFGFESKCEFFHVTNLKIYNQLLKSN